MKTEQVLLSQALAHHWSYLPLSGATQQSIKGFMVTQRQSLRRSLAPSSGMGARGTATPTAALTCGWNASVYVSQYLERDFTAGQVNYYVSRDCSSIVLDNSTTQLSGCYCDAMFWQDSEYNQGSYPYCWTHNCFFGWFVQSIAPPYHVWQENYNASEDAGYDYEQMYSPCTLPYWQGPCYNYPHFWMDFGNLY